MLAYKVFEGESGGKVKITGCLAHARRRFVLALYLLNVKGLSDDAISELPEVKAIELIGKIYKEESLLKDLDAASRKEKRQGRVKKAVDSFFDYIRTIDTEDPSISNRLKDAVSYALNQEKYLRRFLDDGSIPLDNLLREKYSQRSPRQTQLAVLQYSRRSRGLHGLLLDSRNCKTEWGSSLLLS